MDEFRNFEDIKGYISKAFRLSNKARSRRVEGKANQVISDLRKWIDEFDNNSMLVGLQQTICRDAMLKMLCTLGRSYGETGQNDLADDVFKRALKLGPMDEFVWYSIAGYYRHLAADVRQRPPHFHDFAMSLSGDLTSTLVGCGIAHYQIATASKDRAIQLKHDDKAIHYWREALRVEPRNTSILFMLSKAHYVRGEDGQACIYARRIIEQKNMPEALIILIAVSPPDSPFVTHLRIAMSSEIDGLQAAANSLQRDPLRIWTLQQDLRRQSALSDGVYNTVWQVAERKGLERLRPVNEGAKSGITDIRHAHHDPK